MNLIRDTRRRPEVRGADGRSHGGTLVRYVAAGAAVVALVAGCSSAPATPAPAPAPAPVVAAPPPRPVPSASAAAIVRDVSGKQVGSMQLTETYAGVLITGSIGNLGLGGHAIHIHEVGKCEVPYTTAGGHFNPTNRHHGYKSPTGPHLGDLPNLELPAAGVQKFEMLLPGVMLKGPSGLLDGNGAAIVVHASRDDYIGDPSGNSGGRIACGVIVQR
jgi:Cu-Zn family superoxide dismutase